VPRIGECTESGPVHSAVMGEESQRRQYRQQRLTSKDPHGV